nr:hypothetical protein [Candidatus Sigynarchaeota archaeon]
MIRTRNLIKGLALHTSTLEGIAFEISCIFLVVQERSDKNMNDQERKDAARLLKRDQKDQHDDDNVRVQTSWARRYGNRMRKDGLS